MSFDTREKSRSALGEGPEGVSRNVRVAVPPAISRVLQRAKISRAKCVTVGGGESRRSLSHFENRHRDERFPPTGRARLATINTPAVVSAAARRGDAAWHVNRHPGARLFADLLARHIDDDETKHRGGRQAVFRARKLRLRSRLACTVHARETSTSPWHLYLYLFLASSRFVHPSVRPFKGSARSSRCPFRIRRACRSYMLMPAGGSRDAIQFSSLTPSPTPSSSLK